jgi:hypothetical protein
MNPTESTPAANHETPPAVLAAELMPPAGLPAAAQQPLHRRSGYGLPCAKCRTYYPADLAVCPVCKTADRVSPVVARSIPSAPVVTEPAIDPAALEEERDRFLKEFEAQIRTGNMQITATESFRCSREENHPGAFEPASVCQGCYEHARERVDLMEAALLIDPKDAAQIVYAAVWADPSDPSKTYLNAAQALLAELHRRAGISAVLGPHQPLPH